MSWRLIGIAIVSVLVIRGFYSYHKEGGVVEDRSPEGLEISTKAIAPIQTQKKIESPSPSQPNKIGWALRVDDLKKTKFKDPGQFMGAVSELVNGLMSDDNLNSEDKYKLRKEIGEFEAEINKSLPEKELVGVKQELIDPDNPNSGYKVDPEFR